MWVFARSVEVPISVWCVPYGAISCVSVQFLRQINAVCDSTEAGKLAWREYVALYFYCKCNIPNAVDSTRNCDSKQILIRKAFLRLL